MLAATGTANARQQERYVGPREYYAHRLQVRELLDDDGAALLDDDGRARRDDALTRWARLFQEYCCMALAKTETQRLKWYEDHQADIRADLYQNLADAVDAHDGSTGQQLAVGKRIVLPSSFTNGPRDMGACAPESRGIA